MLEVHLGIDDPGGVISVHGLARITDHRPARLVQDPPLDGGCK
jgi:hypothetical protein